MPRRVAALVLAFGCLGWGCSHPAESSNPHVVPLSQKSSLESQPIPTTLDEALDALERGGSGVFHARMRSDDESIAMGVQFEMGLPERWGLGYGSPLDTHLSSLGFRRPSEKRDAILR